MNAHPPDRESAGAAPLAREEAALLDAARAARARALGPTAAGAAVRTADGTVFTAGSVELSVPSLSACAGQVAIHRAVAAGRRDIVALARVRPHSSSAPCGRCLQILHEFAPRAVVIWESEDGRPRRATAGDLLPLPFVQF
jgi:cytidine deaminase